MFITNTLSINKAFKIINLRCNLLLSQVTNQQDYGILPDIDLDYPDYPLYVVSKASVDSQFINLSWDVLDPTTNKIYEYNNDNFAGFTIDLLDIDNNFVLNLSSNSQRSNFSFDPGVLKNWSLLYFGDENYLRNARIRITSSTFDGKTSIAYYIFNFPISSFNNVSVNITNGLFVNYEISEKQYVNKVSIQSSFDTIFNNTYASVIDDPSSTIFISDVDIDKLFYRLTSQDFYNTGTPYLLGQLKLDNIDSSVFNVKPENLSGAISVSYDSTLNQYDAKLFIKWSPNYTNVPLNYEILVNQNDDKNVSNVYYLNAPKIEKINYYQCLKGL